MKLNKDQKKQLAEIFGNMSVAWFSLGVISPIFIKPKTLSEFFTNLGLGLIFSFVFIIISLQFLKK